MKLGYVVRIGHCFYRIGMDSGECRIVKDIKNANFFSEKKRAIDVANKYGGRAFKLQLSVLDEEKVIAVD